jgi:hypothetical protein
MEYAERDSLPDDERLPWIREEIVHKKLVGLEAWNATAEHKPVRLCTVILPCTTPPPAAAAQCLACPSSNFHVTYR